MHLDLSTCPSLALPALQLVASLASTLLLLFSSLLAPARSIPQLYGRLTQSSADSLAVRQVSDG